MNIVPIHHRGNEQKKFEHFFLTSKPKSARRLFFVTRIAHTRQKTEKKSVLDQKSIFLFWL